MSSARRADSPIREGRDMAKRKRRKPAPKPKLVRQDGALCVTFVNTANARRKTLKSYADLLAWGQQSGVLSGATRTLDEARPP